MLPWNFAGSVYHKPNPTLLPSGILHTPVSIVKSPAGRTMGPSLATVGEAVIFCKMTGAFPSAWEALWNR